MLHQQRQQLGKTGGLEVGQERAHPGEGPQPAPRPARHPGRRPRPDPDRQDRHDHQRPERHPVDPVLPDDAQPSQRRGHPQAQRLIRRGEPRRHQEHQPDEQHIRQAEHEPGIPEGQSDRPAGVGDAADVGGQSLQGRRQPTGPRPGLDHRAIQWRDRAALRLERLGQPLAPLHPPPEQPRDPPQPAPDVAARLQQPSPQRQPRPHQRRDLLVERQQLVQRDRPRRPPPTTRVRHRPHPLSRLGHL